MSQIRVLVADDQPLLRIGIAAMLASEPDIVVVGEAADGREALQLCRELEPDVLLLDLSMPGPSLPELLGSLREHHPGIKVLAVTVHDENAYVRHSIRTGVAGYLLKEEAPEAVVDAIRTVVQGGTWLSRSIAEQLAAQPNQDPLAGLTARERDVLELIALGWDNARIAAELGLAQQTVRNYTSQIYQKLDIRSRAEAIVWARQHGIVAQ